MRPRVVIIGGGMAGLAASYALNGTVRSGLLAGVTLIEAGSRLGGKVHTERVDGFGIEAGADSFVTAKPAAVEL
ncbi:MAG: NAD(P)-binding protein, partial [Armatimonadetes bacterium]|nr:NAD(P)-binding protein [Armatimonadota bacterium]